MIHQAARDLAIANIGDAEWRGLVQSEGLSERHFIGVEYYPDADTIRLVELISERLDWSMSDTLYRLGRYWIDFAGASAYGRALQMAGGDLETFISNLDRMHASIKSNMPKAQLPSFDVVASDADSIQVLYHSERSGLATFVAGILSAVAERFGEPVEISHADSDGSVLFTLTRAARGSS
jgi:hypothetical protein